MDDSIKISKFKIIKVNSMNIIKNLQVVVYFYGELLQDRMDKQY